jgi:MarR family transcriptional regulator, organic hydroperoxide resistance regulator
MGPKAKRSGNPEELSLSADDFWPLVIEFTLSQRAWWIGLCDEFDLTAMQGHVLRIIDPDKPVAMSTLADALVCDASNVTGIVDKLESRGLIARRNAEGDRRIKMLAVTAKGRELRDQMTARMMEPPAAVKALSPDARRRLAEVLHALVLERTGTSAVSGASKPRE